MKKINISLEPNQNSQEWIIDVEELGFSESEWNNLTDEDKTHHVEEWIESLPEQPFWMLDTFEID